MHSNGQSYDETKIYPHIAKIATRENLIQKSKAENMNWILRGKINGQLHVQELAWVNELHTKFL